MEAAEFRISRSRATYEVRAVGEVPPDLLEDFERVTVSTQAARSTVRAVLVDEAGLQGVLSALKRAGVVIVEVREQDGDSGEDRASVVRRD